jgi:hypothetical protein
VTEIYPLSVRNGRSGDPALAVGPAGSASKLRGTRHAIIFIHGFANSPAEADEKYHRFVRELDKVSQQRRITADTEFFGFQWPGDHRLPVINQLTYSPRVGTASYSGHLLGEFLLEVPRSVEITIVAHSLGCRVLLRALQIVIESDEPIKPQITHVHLMAAAVPVRECISSEAFSSRYANTTYAVYHSCRDRALQLGFGPGQFGFDKFAQAVGRYGRPKEVRWDFRVSTGLAHKEYWGSNSVAAAIVRASGRPAVCALPRRRLAVHRIREIVWSLPWRKIS